MWPFDYRTAFTRPLDFKPPNEVKLHTDLEYPNLNSHDYKVRPFNRTLHLYPSWEGITLSSRNLIAIAANKYSGRGWKGSIWGFHDLYQNMNEKTAVFKFQCDNIVVALQFVTQDILLVGLRNGAIQLWNLFADTNQQKQTNSYCPLRMFNAMYNSWRQSTLTCLKTSKPSDAIAISGHNDGTIKLWDIKCFKEINDMGSFQFAHLSAVNDFDFPYKEENIFVSCSSDKSTLLWDMRTAIPASALYENHYGAFNCVSFTNKLNKNVIRLGDSGGYTHLIDLRLPKTFLKSENMFDESLRKICSRGKNIAYLADTNKVKITMGSSDNIFSNDDSQHFIRDGVWLNDYTFLTVGYEGKLRQHDLKKKL